MMKMKAITISIFIIFSNVIIYSQSATEFDLEKIKLATQDTNSEKFYPKLVTRFEQDDSTLTIDDYQHFYYGFAFQENFNPLISKIDSVNKLFQRNEFNQIIRLCDTLLSKNPTSLTALLSKQIAIREIHGEKESYKTHKRKLDNLINAILHTGNGLNTETAYYITNVFDEYLIMDYKYNIDQIKKQELINGCDVFTINKTPEFKSNKIVFNISLGLAYWDKLFTKNENRLYEPRQIEDYNYISTINCHSAVISDNYKYIAIGSEENRIKIYRLYNWDLVIDTIINTKNTIRSHISYFSKDDKYFYASMWKNYHKKTTVEWRIDLMTGEIEKFKSEDLKGIKSYNRNDKYLSDQEHYGNNNNELYTGVFLFTIKNNRLDIYIEKNANK